jgi:hypothetical protein
LKILAFDPGSNLIGTKSQTGVVLLGVNAPHNTPCISVFCPKCSKGKAAPNAVEIELLGKFALSDGIVGVKRFAKDHPDMKNSDVIIYEAFDDRSTVCDSSVKETIGAIVSEFENALPQRNTGYKGVATDEMLRALNLPISGGHHADIKSASRHALYCVIKQKDYMVNEYIANKTLRSVLL